MGDITIEIRLRMGWDEDEIYEIEMIDWEEIKDQTRWSSVEMRWDWGKGWDEFLKNGIEMRWN